jgi:hypothetical protein
MGWMDDIASTHVVKSVEIGAVSCGERGRFGTSVLDALKSVRRALSLISFYFFGISMSRAQLQQLLRDTSEQEEAPAAVPDPNHSSYVVAIIQNRAKEVRPHTRDRLMRA